MDFNFADLSDRRIAEILFTHFGKRLFSYAMKSWNFNEDEVWDSLYNTIYTFIGSYADEAFSSEKQIESLIWIIFKNKLRDKYRHLKRIGAHYKEAAISEEILLSNTDSQSDSASLWYQYSDHVLIEEAENPILSNLESILENLEDWEGQLAIGRANNIPYKQIEEMTGKKAGFLKVHYQRLKERISTKLKENINNK